MAIQQKRFPMNISKEKAEHLMVLYDAIYFISGQMEQFRSDEELHETEQHLNRAISTMSDYLTDNNVNENYNVLDYRFRSVSEYYDKYDSNSEEKRNKGGSLFYK